MSSSIQLSCSLLIFLFLIYKTSLTSAQQQIRWYDNCDSFNISRPLMKNLNEIDLL